METRRAILPALALAGAGTVLASCSGTPVDVSALEKQLVDIITKIQQGVKDACTLVPTADTVLSVLRAIAGAASAIAGADTIALYLTGMQQAIDFISKACPKPGAARGAQSSITINEKDIPIVWY